MHQIHHKFGSYHREMVEGQGCKLTLRILEINGLSKIGVPSSLYRWRI